MSTKCSGLYARRKKSLSALRRAEACRAVAERAADALHRPRIDAELLGNNAYAGPPRSRQSLTDSPLELRYGCRALLLSSQRPLLMWKQTNKSPFREVTINYFK